MPDDELKDRPDGAIAALLGIRPIAFEILGLQQFGPQEREEAAPVEPVILG